MMRVIFNEDANITKVVYRRVPSSLDDFDTPVTGSWCCAWLQNKRDLESRLYIANNKCAIYIYVFLKKLVQRWENLQNTPLMLIQNYSILLRNWKQQAENTYWVNMVTWSFLLFAVCRKCNSKSGVSILNVLEEVRIDCVFKLIFSFDYLQYGVHISSICGELCISDHLC